MDGVGATHLLQEAQEEVSGAGVVGEEATDGLVQHVGVETPAGGRQRPQSSEDEARLLPGHRLLYLLHVLLDVCGTDAGSSQHAGRTSR